MDFKEICKARYSVRAYKPDAIPAEKINGSEGGARTHNLPVNSRLLCH